ncbi:hypothetical protein [Shewanella sp. 10N.286.48.A6]|uniref:hypothetical protein n=1 Tax=Shewanella sp. 10N.286.48.A6 TaxID=1880833 RepID=UPI001054B8B7|nr:hypothetical protein [Shewanella sp. 10N.286.48.A6]
MQIHDIEKFEDILKVASGAIFAGRRADIVATINGKEFIVEVKNHFASTYKTRLNNAMGTSPQKSTDGIKAVAKDTQQLYTDLLRYIKNGNSGRFYLYTPDVISVGENLDDVAKVKLRQDPELIKQTEDEIIEHMQMLFTKNEARFAKDLGFKLKDKASREAWEGKKVLLYEAMEGDGPDGVKFVQIYPFENIIKEVIK